MKNMWLAIFQEDDILVLNPANRTAIVSITVENRPNTRLPEIFKMWAMILTSGARLMLVFILSISSRFNWQLFPYRRAEQLVQLQVSATCCRVRRSRFSPLRSRVSPRSTYPQPHEPYKMCCRWTLWQHICKLKNSAVDWDNLSSVGWSQAVVFCRVNWKPVAAVLLPLCCTRGCRYFYLLYFNLTLT